MIPRRGGDGRTRRPIVTARERPVAPEKPADSATERGRSRSFMRAPPPGRSQSRGQRPTTVTEQTCHERAAERGRRRGPRSSRPSFVDHESHERAGEMRDWAMKTRTQERGRNQHLPASAMCQLPMPARRDAHRPEDLSKRRATPPEQAGENPAERRPVPSTPDNDRSGTRSRALASARAVADHDPRAKAERRPSACTGRTRSRARRRCSTEIRATTCVNHDQCWV